MLNWDAIGATGEIAGAVAVIVTIVYLARQVRDNSKQVKLNTTQSYASLVQDAYSSVYSNAQTIRAWIVGTDDPHALTDEELKLYLHLMDRQLNNAVPLLHHFNEGAMSKEEFEHYKGFFVRLVSSEGGKYWVEHRGSDFKLVMKSFREA